VEFKRTATVQHMKLSLYTSWRYTRQQRYT